MTEVKRNFDRLEVGEFYQSVCGNIVKITTIDNEISPTYNFEDAAGNTWTDDGIYSLCESEPHPLDLILHIEPPTIVPKKRKVMRGRVLYKDCYGDLAISQGEYTQKEFNDRVSETGFIRIIDNIPEFPVEYVKE